MSAGWRTGTALVTGTTLMLAATAQAQTSPQTLAGGPILRASLSPGQPSSAPSAIGVLLNQANYWRLQNRTDLALEALNRALLLDPGNADALAQSAEIHAALGDPAEAQAALAALRAAHPDDPRIATIAQALRTGPIDTAALSEARALAQQGRPAEAVARYRAIFRDAAPPNAFAVEYYQVLAGTAGGWEQAQDGLAHYVVANPQDTHGQLAYAQLLTYRPATRADGISRLAILANNPATAEAARIAWRRAMDWIPTDQTSVPLYQAYLARHPDDAGVAQHLTEAQNPRRTPADEAGADRQRGFDPLQANRLGDAEAAFQSALAINAEDADALGGMGLVRQRQNRGPEARDLLERAIATASDRAAQWQSPLNGVATSVEMASAQALANRGQLAQAAAQLRSVIARGGDVTGAQAMLAGILARSGDLAGAETSYRAVLARQPDNATALVGLANVLTQRGHPDEADALLARANATGHGQLVANARAAQLRAQAQQATDPDTAIALYRAAVAAAPSDPWIRLDLARLLLKQGQGADARTVMAALTDSSAPSVDALHAAALFASEDNRTDDAASLASRIPAASRPADLARILANARFQQQVRQAIADSATSGDARQRLLALAAAPDPDGTRGAAIIRALGKINDASGARQAVALELATNRNPSAAARLAYAGALLEAGLDTDAARLANTVDAAGDVTPDQRAALSKLRDGIAIRGSDTLNQAGRTAEAYDQLAPALRQTPTDPDLNLALARLYQTARQPRQSLVIAQALLRRDPGNLDARRTAVGAAIALGDLGAAQTLVDEGLSVSRDDPRTWVMAADLARAKGDNGAVLTDLRQARDLRRQQIGADQTASTDRGGSDAPPSDDNAENPFRQPDATQVAQPLRLADASGLFPTGTQAPFNTADPLTNEINRAIIAAQEANSNNAQIGASYRVRSGSAGLDSLTETAVPMVASVSPGGVGRLTLRATPTVLSGGTLSGTAQSQAQFGSLALGGPAAENQHAQGVGLSAEYVYRWVDADAGTTPLGFRIQNAVGGVVLTPEIADGVRLRLTGERRAVTDSVLSYAGTVDPRTGTIFGGVTRTRGDAQLELTSGLANFYIGAGYDVYNGEQVEQNHEFEFGAGGAYPVYRAGNNELRVGLDLIYFGYGKNLRYFTLGQGGYFSPQSYFAARIPVTYTSRGDDLIWSVGASLGVQNYNEDSSPVFPQNAALQSQLVALAANNPTVMTAYPSQSQSGVVGGVTGSFEYKIDPAVRIGGLFSFDKAGDYNETRAMLYARYVFNATQ